MKKALLLLVSALIIGTTAFAQKKRAPYTPWEVGADLGISLFGNEFNMNKPARWNRIDHWKSKPAFGGELFVRKYFGYVLGAELNYSYNTLKGEWDENFATNTPDFKTRVNDIGLQAVVNFNNLFSKQRTDRDWFIFGKGGVGMGWTNNKDGLIEDRNDTKFFIPLGLGLAYKLTDAINVNLGADYKFMFTDRLDGRYETGVTGSAGNPTTGIWGSYAMFSAGASYRFGERGQEKAMASNVIPASKPTPKPAPKPEMVKPTPPPTQYRPTPKPTPPPTQYKPAPKPAVKPAPVMAATTIDGLMMAEKGWPVNCGYVHGEIPASGITYRVQVFATYHQAESVEKLGNMIRVSEDLIEYRGKKLYKYATVRTFDSYKSALAAAREINRTAKISDAFVVAFKGTKHIY